MKVNSNGSTPPGTLRFPRLSSSTVSKPWQPTLVGEGDFPKDQPTDAIALAQQALSRMEAGMLKLHKAVEESHAQDDRPRAA